ncbi:MAG: RIP metalloprotease RseP [Candidatus Desulforudis sp.]|nr:RIP metalloprotease RseP [Desulforudis sp.]
MITIFAVIVVFGLLIFIHELGHFLVAKRAGILVYEFALGFGPRLTGFRRGETDYTLRAVPLGGFVRFAGMDPREEEVPPERDYKYKPVWQRMAVISAGPIANFLLAIVLLAGVFMAQGMPMPTTVVDEVLPGSPATEAGFRQGDRIIAVDGREVNAWDELVSLISARPGEQLVLTVEREGSVLDIPVIPKEEAGVGRIGIRPEPRVMSVGPLTALAGGWDYTVQLTGMIIAFLGQMITGQAPADVGGPVRIVAEIGSAAQLGVIPLLHLAAFLSINVGFFNLLPIPALDGSRLLFLTWEGVTRRPLNPEREGTFHLVGFALLLLLIMVITYRDIAQLAM